MMLSRQKIVQIIFSQPLTGLSNKFLHVLFDRIQTEIRKKRKVCQINFFTFFLTAEDAEKANFCFLCLNSVIFELR